MIRLLDSETIDKIAAGEVVERPVSIVKELVENALDSGADAITVEITDGGTEMIRVTDNGCGILASEVRTAFFRHATSKIQNADDLMHVTSLGFRGEALSSIAAVSKTQIITKTKDQLTGISYSINGGVEQEFSEVGAPDGTTIIVRNLFYNIPVRRKFLKSAATEGSYIAETMEHMALSRPDVSFKFVQGHDTKFHTSGNGNLKEVIYRIFGRDISEHLLSLNYESNGIHIEGYIGKPEINRSNRNFENFFVNGRYVRCDILSKAVEEAYKTYVMQHKFPMCVLSVQIPADEIDVNVHPTKLEIRFIRSELFFDTLYESVRQTLTGKEYIPEVILDEKKHAREVQEEKTLLVKNAPEPFERRLVSPIIEPSLKPLSSSEDDFFEVTGLEEQVSPSFTEETQNSQKEVSTMLVNEEPAHLATQACYSEQLELFESGLLSKEAVKKHEIIGQVFDTYWLVKYEDKLFIIDQHAAHEKVKYERLVAQIQNKSVQKQLLNPPIILHLNSRNRQLLKEYQESFEALGYELEDFGGNEIALRGVPMDLYGRNERELFEEILDELAIGPVKGTFDVICSKLASMACKSAVKGNTILSYAEADELIKELLTLDNPYLCPHGRPTIVSISKYEMEKKFKRIV